MITLVNLVCGGYLNSDLTYGFILTVLNLLIKSVGLVAPRIEILSVILYISVFEIAHDAKLSSLKATIIKLFEKNREAFDLMCPNENMESKLSTFYMIESRVSDQFPFNIPEGDNQL